MQIREARFERSSGRLAEIPRGEAPQIAFIGRSNVGKSSLINMLTRRAGLAKVSSTPGKTQLINHFLIDGTWYLVDLPGYGYARTSKRTREGFSRRIEDYIFRSDAMHFLFVLIDIRLEPQAIDLRFIDLLGSHGVPFAIVFTKADKLSAAQRARSIERFRAALAPSWEELPPMTVTSAEAGTGREELLAMIEAALESRPIVDK